MANDVTNIVIDHFVGHGHRLFWITGVIILYADQFIAVDAAFGINVRDSLLGPGEFHVAILRNRTGKCANNRHFDIFRQCRMAHRQCYATRQKRITFTDLHPHFPICCACQVVILAPVNY